MDEPDPSPPAPFRLSPRQQSAVAAALTIVAAAVILGAILGLGWAVSVFLQRFSNVFLPLAVGGVAALVFRPYYGWLRRRARLPTPLALAAVFLSILLPLAGFGWFFGALVVDQVTDMLTGLPAWWERVSAQFKERWPSIVEFLRHNPWGQRIRSVVEGSQGALVEGLQNVGGRALSVGNLAFRAIGALVAWAVLPVYFAFFLIAGPAKPRDLRSMLPFLKPETRDDVAYLVQEFVNIVVAFFRGQLIVALLQGLLFAIGFSLIGLRYGFVLGLMLGLLNVIPYLGSIVGLSVCLPLAWFQPGGGPTLLLWFGVVFGIVQLIEGYVLTPKIMGDRTGLHPIAIIVAVFFWGSALNGILGMVLAIPLTAFLVVFWRLVREKYVGELV